MEKGKKGGEGRKRGKEKTRCSVLPVVFTNNDGFDDFWMIFVFVTSFFNCYFVSILVISELGNIGGEEDINTC